jgi:uncharacterized membrane protein
VKTPRSIWLVPAALIALSLIPAGAGILRLSQLAGGAEITSANARFFAAPLPVVLHILAVIPFTMLGAFQVASGFRSRHRRWHRAAGKFVAPAGLLAALTGLWMSHFYPWPEGDGELLYVFRLLFGSAMVLSIFLALNAIRRRDFSSHGAWMLRGYAIGIGAGTQALTHLPWMILVGTPGEFARALLMGAGWMINLVVAEWVIRRRNDRAGSSSRPAVLSTSSKRPVESAPAKIASAA